MKTLGPNERLVFASVISNSEASSDWQGGKEHFRYCPSRETQRSLPKYPPDVAVLIRFSTTGYLADNLTCDLKKKKKMCRIHLHICLGTVCIKHCHLVVTLATFYPGLSPLCLVFPSAHLWLSHTLCTLSPPLDSPNAEFSFSILSSSLGSRLGKWCVYISGSFSSSVFLLKE